MLTGLHPDQLQDAEGKLPHQRRDVLKVLKSVAGIRFARLASFFDKAFAPLIADRFVNVEMMLRSVDAMMKDEETGASAEDDLKAIMDVISTSADHRRLMTAQRITEALNKVWSVYRAVQASMGGVLSLVQTGFDVNGLVGVNTLNWTSAGSKDVILSTTYEVREAGDEIVVNLSGTTVFRTSIEAPDYTQEFDSAIRSWLLARLRRALTE